MAAPLTPLTPITVALDWTPNANHAGFYLASARGLYAARGLAVGFRLPDEDAYALAPAKAVLQGALLGGSDPSSKDQRVGSMALPMQAALLRKSARHLICGRP